MAINIDGTSVSSITIDGTEVQEVTIDGTVVYTAVIDDFNDGDVVEWTSTSGNLTTSTTSYEGSHSGYSNSACSSGDWDAHRRTAFSGGSQVNSITHYWYETSSQNGHAFSFYNSNGNRELSVGSNNPQWTTDDANTSGNGNNFYGGDGYTRWIEFEVVFDWANNSYTLNGRDTQSGSTASYTGTLYYGVDVQDIAVGYAGGDWNGDASDVRVDLIQ